MRKALSSQLSALGLRKTSLGLASFAAALLLAACATPPSRNAASPPPTPTPVPPRASENPEDVRARMRLRPTPFQPESKFPPPQQSEEEEARMANKPGEPELLHGEPAILLDGAPFPEKKLYDPRFPEARRLRYVSADASTPGDGTAEHPWKDLQEALRRLVPGDRLVVAAGIYAGAFRIGPDCRDGTAEAPIQVFTRHAFLKSSGPGAVLTVERAHWQFWEMQIALLDSESAGFVASGAGAHDLALDQSHIYEGKGPAVVLAAGSSRITLSHCHIHQSNGVRIEAGTSDITLVNNHMHHNRAGSVSIGGGPSASAARAIRLLGNRINNDHGPGVDLAHCDGVTLARNRLSNYRPDEEEGFAGEAIRVRSGARNVSFDGGSVLEATIAARIGEAGAGPPPEGIAFTRSLLRNTLTAESVGLDVVAGRTVLFANGVIDGYADPFRVASPGVDGVSIVNTLVLGPKLAFRIASPASLSRFDYDLFGGPDSLEAVVEGKRVRLADWIKGRMQHSGLSRELGLADGDLGRVRGAAVKDAGTAVEGLAFEGAAPDIGIAEH
jgi:hypothetical protein